MEKFFEQSIFTDESITVVQNETKDTQVFKIHQIILSSKSDVFFSIFSKRDWGNTQKEGIMIETNSSLEEFKLFLEMFYASTFDKINEENCLAMLILSNEYGYKPLSETCQKYVEKNLNTSNCFDIYSIFSMYDLDSLKCFDFICSNLETIPTKEVLKLNENCLERILKSETVDCSERDLLKFLLIWAEKNSMEKNLFEYIQVDQIEDKSILKDFQVKKTIKIDRTLNSLFQFNFEKQEFLQSSFDMKMKSSISPKLGNHAVKFGQGQNITIENCDEFDKLSKEMTIMLWINPDHNQNTRLLCKATAGTDNCFTFDLHPNNSLRFICKGICRTIDLNIPSKKWSFVAVTYCSNQIVMYYNGKEIHNETGNFKVQKSHNQLRIGHDSDGSNVFVGKMSKIRVFEKSLESKHIQKCYLAQKSLFK
jgi:hypothetical protein